MDFIGSKKKLNRWIFKQISNWCTLNDEHDPLFLDACSGSGSSSLHAVSEGYRLISNDIMEFPYHIVRGATSMTDEKLEKASHHIDAMNQLTGKSGFFHKKYSPVGDRKYLTEENAQRIDACRSYIETIGDLDITSYLIYCMLEAFSRVCNTMGTHGAFSKKWKPSSLQPFKIQAEYTIYSPNVTVFSEDIINLLKSPEYQQTPADIMYVDPPYVERQYGANYHLYETLAKYDNPALKTKVTGLRDWKSESFSDFCSKKTCLDFTRRIIELSKAKVIFISYSTDGLIHQEEFEDFALDFGDLTIHKQRYRRYKSDNSRNNNDSYLHEYLLQIHC